MKHLPVAAWTVLASGLVAVAWAAQPRGVSAPAQGTTSRDQRAGDPHATAQSVGPEIAARDPFRATRRSADTPYDPQRALTPPPPPVTRPTLTLVGLVAGSDPTAVIEGFPGVEGARVVRRGDVVAGLTVRSIAQGEVRVAGLDTVWVLRVRTLW